MIFYNNFYVYYNIDLFVLLTVMYLEILFYAGL
jgi:hypothetical protein